MEKTLEVKDLCKTYITNKRQNNVLKNISFTVEEGEMIAIMGLPGPENPHCSTQSREWTAPPPEKFSSPAGISLPCLRRSWQA